ncbi:MAG: hypothetical protein ACJAZN_003429 [Planctomycetota bacterium]
MRHSGENMNHPNAYIEPELDATPGPGWDLTQERDHFLILKRSERGVGVQLRGLGNSAFVKPIYWMDRITSALGLQACEGQPSWETWDDSQVDLMVRCIRQAAWVTE